MIEKQTAENTYRLPFWSKDISLIVSANGGTVTVSVLMDSATDQWVDVSTYDADGIYKLGANGLTVKVTPASGAEYAVVAPDV